MATVGLGDIYRYGATFVGYVLVVAAVAGAFIGGGAYLASEVMTITDPSLDALSETRAFVGVFLMAVGAILGTIGFFGLAHKLLTESMEVALAAHEQDGLLEVPDAEAESAEDESDAEPDRPPAGEHEPTPESEPAPEPQQPTPPEPAAAESAAGQPDTTEQPAEESSGDQPLYGEPIEDEPEPAHEPAGADAGPAEEPPVDGESAPAGGPDEPVDVGGHADDRDDSPPEWTPPDPSEFETPDEGPVDDGSADAVDDAEPMGEPEPEPAPEPEPEPAPEPESSDVEEIPDDATLADEGVEGFQPGGEDDPLADRLPSDEE